MTRKQKKYPGLLGKPIESPILGLLDGANEKLSRQVLDEQRIRIGMLFDHFNIDRKDPGRWALLAFELAVRHVPGMRIAPVRKAGRPVRWNVQSMRKLIATVDGIEAMRKQGISDAIRLAKNKDPQLKSIKDLERRYYEAKEKVAQADQALAEWEAAIAPVRKFES